MKADLERLLISETELLELTGFDRQKILQAQQLSPSQARIQKLVAIATLVIAFITFTSVFLPTLRVTGIVFLISLTLGALSLAIEFAEVAILCFCVAIGSAVYSLFVLTGTTVGVILLCLSLAIACGVLAFFLTQWMMKTWKTSQKTQQQKLIPPIILRLFKEVDKCNKAIHDIDICDQLKDAGNLIKLESRESAIAALRMTRNDLVRALKTERILRENPDFHPDFDIDLNAFEALQISDRAKEYGRVLDTTLQIAIDVKKAMQELQKVI